MDNIQKSVFPIITMVQLFVINSSSFYHYTLSDNYTMFTPWHIILTILLSLCILFAYFNWNSFGRKLFYIIIIPVTLFLSGNYTYTLTNYYFYDKQSRQRITVTVNKKEIISKRIFRLHSKTIYQTRLRFDDDKFVTIDNTSFYSKAKEGDSVQIYIYNGLWGIPVVQEKDFSSYKIR